MEAARVLARLVGVRTAVILIAAAFLAVPSTGLAYGGKVQFVGGTPREQRQVTAALQVSTFDWDVLPAVVNVHIVPGANSHALPGDVYLDADLLDAGTFAWGVVQHEFAHEFDFFFLRASDHTTLLPQLGGVAWFANGAVGEAPDGGLAHQQLGAERFASTFAWSFWQSSSNTMKPRSKNDESAAMAPAAFRALIASIVARSASPA